MNKYLLLVSFVVALGGLLFGFDTAVISGANPFIQPYFGISDWMLGWAVSSVILGCVVGVIFAGPIGDMLGRKKPLMAVAILFLISALGSALAKDFTVFVVFRIIGGLAVGAASMLSPVYISEVSPTQHRGKLVALNQLTIVIGILVAFFSNYILVDIPENNWRWMFGVEAIPAFLFFIALFFIPESPRWLLLKGKDILANQLWSKLQGYENNDILTTPPKTEFSFSILKEKKYFKWIIIGAVLAFLQQMTGINIIMYYAPNIFSAAGFSTDNALLQTILIGVVNLSFTFVAMRFVDSFGRKKLLLIGTTLMFVFLSILAYLFMTGYQQSLITLIAILCFIASFACSMGPVLWVIISEIYPSEIRATASAISISSLWIGAFLVSLTFPVMLNSWGGGYSFLFYALCNLVSFLFVWKYIPKTKGFSLEEITVKLYKKK